MRHWRRDDAPALASAWADTDITSWNPPPDGLDASAWIAGVEERWSRRLALDLVIVAPDERVGGEVGLSGFTTDPARAELGVWVAAPHRRTGLAARAVDSATRWALTQLGLDQVWARTDPANTAAEALFVRLGWDHVGSSGGMSIWSATAAVLR